MYPRSCLYLSCSFLGLTFDWRPASLVMSFVSYIFDPGASFYTKLLRIIRNGGQNNRP